MGLGYFYDKAVKNQQKMAGKQCRAVVKGIKPCKGKMTYDPKGKNGATDF